MAPLSIELVLGGKVVGGVNEWWDNIELAIRNRLTEFPMLATVDPYDDAELHRDAILREGKLRRLQPDYNDKFVEKLIAVCVAAAATPGRGAAKRTAAAPVIRRYSERRTCLRSKGIQRKLYGEESCRISTYELSYKDDAHSASVAEDDHRPVASDGGRRAGNGAGNR